MSRRNSAQASANVAPVSTMPGSVPARAWARTSRTRSSAARFVNQPARGRPRRVQAGPIVRCTWRPSGRRYLARQTGPSEPS